MGAVSISSSHITIASTYEYQLGPGLVGWVKDAYITDTLEDDHSFRMIVNNFGTLYKKCHTNTYYQDPYYVNPG